MALALTAAIVVPSWWMATRDLPNAPEVDARTRAQADNVARATTSTSTTSTLPPTTTVPAERVGVAELPGRRTAVISGHAGLLLAAPDGALPVRRLVPEATYRAYGVGPGRVVAQLLDPGPRIVVYDDRAAHEVLRGVDEGTRLDAYDLLDAGFARGRPLAVVRARSNVADREPYHREELVLLDLETLERTELGSISAWEEGIDEAVLLPDASVVVIQVHEGGETLLRVRPDGTRSWSVELDPEHLHALAVRHPDRSHRSTGLLVIGRPSGGPDAPHLIVDERDPWTGAVEQSTDLALDLPPLPDTEGGLCSVVDLDEGQLVCDRWEGPPLRIDLEHGTTAPQPGAPPGSSVTFWRFD
jgi:hypothetical protein